MNSEMNSINSYLQKVEEWLPHPMKMKKKLLESLKSDVFEAINDSEKKDPVVAFGDPYTVAKSITKGQDLGTVRANYERRFWAFVIDYSIINLALGIGFTWWIYGVLFPALETRPTLLIPIFTGIFVMIPYVIFWIYGYFVVFEKMFSKTPGKRLLGLSVYDASGVRITWIQALTRNITKIDIFLLFLELLIAHYKDTNYQSLMDTLANTEVVKRKEIGRNNTKFIKTEVE
ncbi:MAG: RDD family protein [Candidatus Hodarchaeales archaeon]|jgi:uncharacterized RDD family membrane protein YckC